MHNLYATKKLKAPIPGQGMEFYGKAMKTMYGKGKSDAVAKVRNP